MAVLSRRDDPDAASRGETAFIAAATSLLEEGTPYADLAIGTIAKRAGHTRTGFYFYFRDKRELLVRATDAVVGDIFERADEWWGGTGGLPELRKALSDIMATYRRSGALLAAMVEAATYDTVIADAWNGEVQRFIASLTERVEADGFPPAQAQPIASSLAWMVERACYQQVQIPDQATDAAVVDALVTIWARTLGVTPPA